MEKKRRLRWKLILIFMPTVIFLTIITVSAPSYMRASFTKPRRPPPQCPHIISRETITPLNNTQHLVVSGYMDQRVEGQDVRIIGMFKRDSIQPLYCHFCCAGNSSEGTPAKILQHSDNFGFPYVTTDVMCKIPPGCSASHLTLQTFSNNSNPSNYTWIPLRNQKAEATVGERLNITVCISNLFGDYNNVLQLTQTLEMYRLLGVDKVAIYNTSCGPDLDRLLRSYSQEGFLEIVPWPIDKHLNPSTGWLFSQHGGDLHYFGQLTTLNECVYRYMERSRYVFLNDMDEIIMPYQHDNLMSMMNTLQKEHPTTGIFLIENHIFPKKHFEPSKRFQLPQWNGVPGINILEHIYREEPDRKIYHPYKIIIQPRLVEQTSVHEVLKSFTQAYKVPPEVCHLIHVRSALQGSKTLEELHVDKRLWDFQEKLIPKVDEALRRVGLLNSEM